MISLDLAMFPWYRAWANRFLPSWGLPLLDTSDAELHPHLVDAWAWRAVRAAPDRVLLAAPAHQAPDVFPPEGFPADLQFERGWFRVGSSPASPFQAGVFHPPEAPPATGTGFSGWLPATVTTASGTRFRLHSPLSGTGCPGRLLTDRPVRVSFPVPVTALHLLGTPLEVTEGRLHVLSGSNSTAGSLSIADQDRSFRRLVEEHTSLMVLGALPERRISLSEPLEEITLSWTGSGPFVLWAVSGEP